MNDREHLGKFDSKSDEGVFFYSNNSKALCIYNMRTQNIIEFVNGVINDYQDFANYSIEEEITNLLETPNVVTAAPEVRVIEKGKFSEPFLKEKEPVEKDVSKETPENMKEKVSKLQASMDLEDPIKKEPLSKVKKNHSSDLIIGNLDEQIITRKMYANMGRFTCFVSLTEPKNVKEAFVDEFWVKTMQDELEQFKRNDIWMLVPRLSHTNVIGIKWIFKSKIDEFGNIVRNKVRLVVQCYM